MAKRNDIYQVVYRGESLTHYFPGGWVFFQRPKENGGGYWFGRTFDGVYMLEFMTPISLAQGLEYLQQLQFPVIDTEENKQPGENLSLF